MKKFVFLVLAVLLCPACMKEEVKGSISIAVEQTSYNETRITEDIPDIKDFKLEITDSKGRSVYSGPYGEVPEKIMVKSGSYNVGIRSRDFRKPVFSCPQFGDEQLVVVPPGENASVLLRCVMINSGIRLRMGTDFLNAYPDAVVFIEAADGRLTYAWAERRIAYFPPGKVTVYMDLQGKRKDLFSRVLQKREILDIRLVAPEHGAAGKEIEVQLDTSRFWIDERFRIGGGGASHDGGGSPTDAMSVGMAQSAVGSKEVWVYGYIVGCMSGSNLLVDEPFSVSSNIVIASNRFIDDRESCLAVELKKTSVREALNLADNPHLLGKKVYIRGDIVESYFGDAGMKSADDYQLP